MTDLLGGILLIGGSFGLGCLYLEKEKRRMEELKRMAYLFRLMKSEITFKRQPLPYACKASGEKLSGEVGRILEEISEEMEAGKGESFAGLWREKWRSYIKESTLSKEEQSRVLEFASFVGYEEIQMQENMMEGQIEEFILLAGKVREELEKKKRVVLTLSTCLGIIFVLILL